MHGTRGLVFRTIRGADGVGIPECFPVGGRGAGPCTVVEILETDPLIWIVNIRF